MSNTVSHPTISRRGLGKRLKQAREVAGLSEQEAAGLLGYTIKSIRRIEAGTQGTKQTTIEGFVRHYSIAPDEASYLQTLRVRGAERGWWEDYIDKGTKEDTRPDFPMFLESEQIAILIRAFESEVIPGLLQTREYLQAIQAAQLPIPADVAERVLRLRERRQRIFQGTRVPRMQFLMGEAALLYLMRLAPQIRDGQIARLRDVSAMPGVEIRVLTELHAAVAGSFAIVTTPDDFPPIVYTDQLDGCRYLEDVDVTSRYEQAFSVARQKSVPIEEYLK
jgi:transcriptional regulator with XRE-family HTH domain